MLDFDLEHLGIILALAVVTVLSRGFFVLSDQAFKLPY